MRTIEVVELLTLDGVMQSPGSADEDSSGGFRHGGWATPYSDEIMGEEMGKGMGRTDLLLGRRTYEILRAAWADRTDPNPFTRVLNESRKYVASRTLTLPLPWTNSVLLDGDAVDAVSRLKGGTGQDLVIMGSGELVSSLIDHDLIDRYTLLVHPIRLGSGRRLFRDAGQPAKLRLDSCVASSTGVLITRYARA